MARRLDYPTVPKPDDAPPSSVEQHKCDDERCGEPRPGGRAPKGWIQVKAEWPDSVGPEARWFCGWTCVTYAGIAAELAGGDP